MIKILYKDKNITICEKLPGMLSEQKESNDSLPTLLKQQVGYDVYPLHRLDKPVGGAIMLANNKNAAAAFSKLISENGVKKRYLAVIDGTPSETTGNLNDFLFHDSRKNKTYVVKKMRKGVKEASLKYEVLTSKSDHSLVRIELITGRTHQIRAQFASRKMPVTGDGKYGSHDNKCETTLWSHSLCFRHPISGKVIQIESYPPMNGYPWNLFKTENNT